MKRLALAVLAVLLLAGCGSSKPKALVCHPRTPPSMGECVAQQYRAQGKLKALLRQSVSGPQGVDVSVYQDYPDWGYAKAHGLTFVYDQAAYGASGTEDNFYTNTVRQRALGLAYGAYVYVYPRCASAYSVARHLVTVVDAAGGFNSLPPAIDQENDGCAPHDYAIAEWDCELANDIRHLDGWSSVVLYTSPGLWDGVGTDTCGDYLWLADWGDFTLPEGFTHAVAQQYCGVFCTFPGIDGYVDRDVSFSLLQLARHYQPPKPVCSINTPSPCSTKQLLAWRETLRYLLATPKFAPLHGCRYREAHHKRLGPDCTAWFKQGDAIDAVLAKR